VLRLKPRGSLVFLNNSVIDESTFSPVTQLVLNACRTYGIMPLRLGPGMTIVTESISTGSVRMNSSQAQVLAGNNTIVPRDGAGLW
jgi:hypothetical protein